MKSIMDKILFLVDVFYVLLNFVLTSANYQSDFQSVEVLQVPSNKYVTSHKYRPIYHITAPEGWLSSPSGLTYFKRQYHLFYQYHPYNGVWGHMSWGHSVSDNLIDWTHYPSAILPKDYYDRHGCLAGSAFVHKGFLTLIYTGHVVSNNETFESQNIAISGDGLIFRKYLYNPVIRESPSAKGGFKNPKVWRFQDLWYMLVGFTSKEGFGALALYISTDMFDWKFNGTIVESFGDTGFIWESPDLFELDGNHVLIISAQGVDTDGYRFRNLYQTGYVICTFNYLKRRFDDIEVSTATFHQLDYGHDFYAAKTIHANDGRRLLVAWLGVWESNIAESGAGWASMLTLVRELRLNKLGRIFMTPIREMVELRTEVLENAWYNSGESFKTGTKHFELLVNSSTAYSDISLTFEWRSGRFAISYSAEHGYVRIDRGGLDGIRRAYWSPVDQVFIRIFVDASSIEVFCGEGEVVFSSRIYPKAMKIKNQGTTKVHMLLYKLRGSLNFDEKLKAEMKIEASGSSQF